MHFMFYALTNSGRNSEKNEDRIMVDGNLMKNGELAGHSDDSLLAVICDGVGDCNFGDKAASTAALSLIEACDSKQDPFTLCTALFKADSKVKAEQEKDKLNTNMKTTVAALYLDEDGYLAFNAGNTRIYQFCEGVLKQLSEDHPSTRYLGDKKARFKPSVAGAVYSDATSSKYLLCSDGAYKSVSDARLADILELPISLEKKTQIIHSLAEENGTGDNISLVLIETCGEPVSVKPAQGNRVN